MISNSHIHLFQFPFPNRFSILSSLPARQPAICIFHASIDVGFGTGNSFCKKTIQPTPGAIFESEDFFKILKNFPVIFNN